ncbi:uncharacterized protein LOC141714447 [Apium graveolens]|uniref:uncharacterized protein LOC141714447 n=1 Tax=Apium graveolens TaxID=4045 RepID=UPI003D7B29B0
MANLAKLDFVASDLSGDNYLSWVVDAELHLSANRLKDIIESGNTPIVEQNAKALIFLRHHIHKNLKSEYLTVKNQPTLWTNLKDRFDLQKLVQFPHARYDWINIRLQDFKSVAEYNSALFKIRSKLILRGENIIDTDMIEKTLLTFHPKTMILIRPTGSAQLPEVHNTSFQKNGRGKGHRGGQGYGQNRGHGNFRG